MTSEVYQIEENGYVFSTDKSRLDVPFVHSFLTRSYWAEGISIEIVRKSIENSLCYGIYHNGTQVGFARVITDFATFGYLGDVFVIEAHRGKSLSKILMRFIMSQPDVKMFRRFILATLDAHELYKQFGFSPLKSPDRFLEIHQPGLYKKNQQP